MVVPGLNVVLITTGSGFEYDDIVPYLTASWVIRKIRCRPTRRGLPGLMQP